VPLTRWADTIERGERLDPADELADARSLPARRTRCAGSWPILTVGSPPSGTAS